ncbi:MAG: hypothetical protein RIQ94_3075 [Pseudomonadota bacterium]
MACISRNHYVLASILTFIHSYIQYVLLFFIILPQVDKHKHELHRIFLAISVFSRPSLKSVFISSNCSCVSFDLLPFIYIHFALAIAIPSL